MSAFLEADLEDIVQYIEDEHYDDIRLSRQELRDTLESLKRSGRGAHSMRHGRWISTYEALAHAAAGGETGDKGCHEMSLGIWVSFPA